MSVLPGVHDTPSVHTSRTSPTENNTFPVVVDLSVADEIVVVISDTPFL